MFWWLGERVTPKPIPNLEVKPLSADGTRKGRVGSRQNSELKLKSPVFRLDFLFCYTGEMQWSERRRVSIAVGIVLLLAGVLGLFWYLFLYAPATCFDGIRNQDERGVDCDGTCTLMCVAPRVDALWTRSVETASGVYHGVSYVKNPEPRARGTRLSYRMSLFDSGNILVAERRGSVDLAPGETRVIFEPNILTGERTPVRALMKLDGGVWERAEPVPQTVKVTLGVVDEESRTFSALLENSTPTALNDVVASALLYDREGVLVTASETKVPVLPARGRQEVVFTWSIPFERPVVTADVVVRHSSRE